MKQTTETGSDTANRKYGVMRSLGTFVGTSYSLIRDTGRTVISGPSKIISLLSKALKRSSKSHKFLSDEEAIRRVVLQEMAHLQGLEGGGLTLSQFEGRLKVMTETILELQKRIDELGLRDSLSAKDMWDAVDSLKTAQTLTNSEMAVLVNIFRKNIALQKPKLVEVGPDDY